METHLGLILKHESNNVWLMQLLPHSVFQRVVTAENLCQETNGDLDSAIVNKMIGSRVIVFEKRVEKNNSYSEFSPDFYFQKEIPQVS